MMELSKEKKKLFNLDDVEAKLGALDTLLYLHLDYFGNSREYIERNKQALIDDYERHGALVGAIIDTVEKARELLAIARENMNDKKD
jgi:hypothetical protein